MENYSNKVLFLVQVLQQQLIKAERERILQQIQSGDLAADTGRKMLRKIDDEGENDDDQEGLSPALAKKLKGVAQQQNHKPTQKPKPGGRK